jgi:hypothetical protein
VLPEIDKLRHKKIQAKLRTEIAIRVEREAADHFMQGSDPFGEWREALGAWRRARDACTRALQELELAQTAYLDALKNALASDAEGQDTPSQG